MTKYFAGRQASEEEILARILIGDKSASEIKALDKDDKHLGDKCYDATCSESELVKSLRYYDKELLILFKRYVSPGNNHPQQNKYISAAGFIRLVKDAL